MDSNEVPSGKMLRTVAAAVNCGISASGLNRTRVRGTGTKDCSADLRARGTSPSSHVAGVLDDPGVEFHAVAPTELWSRWP